LNNIVYIDSLIPYNYIHKNWGFYLETTDYIKEINFNTAEELFTALSPFGSYKEVLDGYVFRGESSQNYELVPSALRVFNKEHLYNISGFGMPINNQSEWDMWQQRAELYALKKFHDLADSRGINLPDVAIFRDNILSDHLSHTALSSINSWLPEELHEIAALAQHFGIPTRLIDWSLNLYSSLYFATSGVVNKEPNEENDNLVLWALNYREIEFSKETVNKYPFTFITPSYYRNENVLNQKGVLTSWKYPQNLSNSLEFNLINRTPFNELLANFVAASKIDLRRSDNSYTILMYKFTLPTSEAIKLYDILIKMGFGSESVYSGLDGVVKRMNEDANRKKFSDG